MFKLGNNTINNFEVWVTATSDPEYFDCLFFEHRDSSNYYIYYINLHKDSRFPVEYKYPPKPIKVKTKKNRFGEEEEEVLPDTKEEQIYRIEYNSYEMRKEMTQPMWKIHKSTLEKVISLM